MIRIWFLIPLLLLFTLITPVISCGAEPAFEPSITTSTAPGYLRVEVSPGGIYAKAGEHIEISCQINSIVNTPVDITSIEVVFFNSEYSVIRKQPMNLIGVSSYNTTYVIRGDEASYKVLVNFTVGSLDPQYYSEYTYDAFPVIIHD